MDNTELASGSGGDTIATDDISGVKFPRSKIVIGADGSNDGDVSAANPLPAVVTNAGTFVVQVDGAALTALQLLDNAIYVDDADWTDSTSSHMLVGGLYQSSLQSITDGDVGPIQLDSNGRVIVSPSTALDVSGATVTVTGTVTANLGATDNAVLDAIQVATEATQAAVEGTLTVGSHAVTNAGTFVVQVDGDALTALQLLDDVVATDASTSPTKGTMIAGHDGTDARRVSVDASGHLQVDVLSSALPSDAATATNQTTLIGHVDGLESAVGDVVTAVQIMDDWDESNRAKVNLIVGQAGITAGAGAVAASTPRVTLASDDPAVALLGTIDTDTGSIATNMTTLAGAVSGSEMQVDIVSSASIAVTNAGTFAVQEDGAALTALQVLDNTVYVDDADWTALTSSHSLIGGVYQSSPGSITDGDTGPVRLTANGAMHVSDAGGSLTVDNGGTFVVQVDGTALSHLSDIKTAVEGTLTVSSASNAVDSNNSTTTPLSMDADFTGTGTDVLAYSGIAVSIYSDQSSDTNGIKLQWSSDNSNWDITEGEDGYSYTGMEERVFNLGIRARYFRVLYENASMGQSDFRLQTLLLTSPPAIGPEYLPSASLPADYPASNVRATLVAQTNGSGDMRPIQASETGVLKTNAGEAVHREDAAHSNQDDGTFILVVRRDTASSGVGASGDYASLNVDSSGRLWSHDPVAVALLTTSDAYLSTIDSKLTKLDSSLSGPTSVPSVDSYTSAAISASAGTANQELVAAPGANKQIWVYGFVGTADTGDGSISLQDEDDTALSGVIPVQQNGGFSMSPSGNFAMPWLKVATNKALEIDTVTCGFKGAISYAVVDVS